MPHEPFGAASLPKASTGLAGGGQYIQATSKSVSLCFLKMASRKGFEPLTYGLGNRCSILLSYRDARRTV